MKAMLQKVRDSNLYCILQPMLMTDAFWNLMDNIDKIDLSNVEVSMTELDIAYYCFLNNCFYLAIKWFISSSFNSRFIYFPQT